MHKGPKISAKTFCILLDILSFFFPSFYFSGVSNLASSPLSPWTKRRRGRGTFGNGQGTNHLDSLVIFA